MGLFTPALYHQSIIMAKKKGEKWYIGTFKQNTGEYN